MQMMIGTLDSIMYAYVVSKFLWVANSKALEQGNTLCQGILRETTLGSINEPTAGAMEAQANVFVIKHRSSLYIFTALFCDDFVIYLCSYLLLTGNLGGKVYF